jgi:predicted CoA-binding protein
MAAHHAQILKAARAVLVVDWPSRDVPDTLAEGGYEVFVKGGPGPRDYGRREFRDGKVVVRPLGQAPDHADLVYAYRPLAELPGIIELASTLGAAAIWRQSGLAGDGENDPRGCWVSGDESRQARGLVESAGMRYVDDTYIADAVRELAAAS